MFQQAEIACGKILLFYVEERWTIPEFMTYMSKRSRAEKMLLRMP
jgi:hypothetical protein